MEKPDAISPADRGPRAKRSTICLRVGSPRAENTASSFPVLLTIMLYNNTVKRRGLSSPYDKQHFDGAALIHRCVPIRNAVERQRQIEDR